MLEKATVAALLSVATLSALAQERVDLQTIMKIRREGLQNSKVMDTARTLTDRFGPRLTSSPQLRAANEWASSQLGSWGLKNARVEPWGEFGRGWTYESATLRLVAPTEAPLVGIPKAWTPGTTGPVRGKVTAVRLETKEDLEANKGKFAGMILLMGETPDLKPQAEGALDRYTEEELRELAAYEITPERSQEARERYRRRREFRRLLNPWLVEEKVLAVLEPGTGGDGGTFDVQSGGSYKPGEPVGVPNVVLAAEHWGRLSRLLASKTDVEVELDVRARFLDDDLRGYNVIAEIPGTDPRGEIVMIGAHIDSWHGGTGATDNASGSAVVMEAARILQAIGAKPRRTIRVALWSGEEQGLLGSRGWVGKNVAAYPEPTDPAEREVPLSQRRNKGTLEKKTEHGKISAYFNLDNGTGRIRGIYAQDNLLAAPIFRAWLEPLHDLGATTVTVRSTSSTDHIPFDEVGVPGFQFIQDDVEYRSRTHHSNADTFERLQREDLMQASVVMATFAWQAANRDQMMPRKPLAE